jgi:hypothetical protein
VSRPCRGPGVGGPRPRSVESQAHPPRFGTDRPPPRATCCRRVGPRHRSAASGAAPTPNESHTTTSTRRRSGPRQPVRRPAARARRVARQRPARDAREVLLPDPLPRHQRVHLRGATARRGPAAPGPPDVGPSLQEVGGERVPERVGAHGPADAGRPRRTPRMPAIPWRVSRPPRWFRNSGRPRPRPGQGRPAAPRVRAHAAAPAAPAAPRAPCSLCRTPGRSPRPGPRRRTSSPTPPTPEPAAVQHLEDGPVAEAGGRSAPARARSATSRPRSADGAARGEPSARPPRPWDPPPPPLREEEPVEGPHGRQRSGRPRWPGTACRRRTRWTPATRRTRPHVIPGPRRGVRHPRNARNLAYRRRSRRYASSRVCETGRVRTVRWSRNSGPAPSVLRHGSRGGQPGSPGSAEDGDVARVRGPRATGGW